MSLAIDCNSALILLLRTILASISDKTLAILFCAAKEGNSIVNALIALSPGRCFKTELLCDLISGFLILVLHK